MMQTQDRHPDFTKTEIDQVRDGASIVDVASLHVSWDRKKTLAVRGDYWACCPFHDESTPSFHVRESTGKFKCFGCGAGGDVIEFLMRVDRVSFPEAMRRLGATPLQPERRYAERQKDVENAATRKAAALAIWRAGEAIGGTVVETYLRQARGIAADLGEAELRFHPRAPRGYELKAGKFPAMLAAIRSGEGEMIGVHVTYLTADGSGKAPMDPDRKMFGSHQGGFIKLGPISPRMVAGEGIESSFSASEISGRSALAAINAHNMGLLPLLDGVTDWLIAYDRDENGVGLKGARALARRLLPTGATMRGFPAPNDCKDWNDVARKVT